MHCPRMSFYEMGVATKVDAISAFNGISRARGHALLPEEVDPSPGQARQMSTCGAGPR